MIKSQKEQRQTNDYNLNIICLLVNTIFIRSNMKDRDGFDFNNPADSAWDMFEKTGNINYYLLYKKLIKK